MADLQRPLRLLSLDGGGVRGLSTLYILKSIMDNLRLKAGLDSHSQLRPCDYFDLIGGTSTGGLIAVMLGTLRMDIQTCINEYLKLAPEIFPVEGLVQRNKTVQLAKGILGRERFKPKPLEMAIKGLVKKYLGERSIEGEETLFRFEASKLEEDRSCNVFVCVTSEKGNKRFRFRSYNSARNVLDDCPIWQACRATSAAPTFFPPMKIGNPPTAYVDGGMGYNNPIRALMEEASYIWPSARTLGCIVSVGTGHLISKDVGKAIVPLLATVVAMATDTEKIAKEFEEEMKRQHGNEQKLYFRFNVQHGLEQVGLEEWTELDRTKVETLHYLDTEWSRVEACSSQIINSRTPTLLPSDEDAKSKDHSFTKEEQECVRSLWPRGVDYKSEKNQNPKRVDNTCLWTLQNSKYIEWRDNDTKKLLWISADPGCGKSVLARCIIDDDLPKAFPNTSPTRILYYFFKDTNPEQRSAARAISTILHQLFDYQPCLIRHAIPSYRRIGPALSTSFPKLWSIFTAAALDPLAGHLTCVLDALDECAEQKEMIEALEEFCLEHQPRFSESRLKFLLTSRPYFDIRSRFNKLLQASDNIELAGNDESASIKTEIDIVIKSKVAKFASDTCLKESVSDHLMKRLLKTENRTYLWLRLIWEIIEKNLSGTITAMNKLIDELPSGIQDSYETLLQKCPDALFAKRVLQVLLVACRPLTLEEIDHAINVNEQTSSYADLELEGSKRLQDTLPSRCGLMVSIVGSKVYFLHQTVKEFLLNEAGTKASAERTWQYSLDLRESHQLMAEICLRSICFSEVELDEVNVWNALLPEEHRGMKPNEYCQSKGLLPYSAIYWAEHFRGQNNSKVMRVIEQCLGNSDCDSDLGEAGECGTTFHAASLGGHGRIVQMLLDKGADVDAQGGYYGSALQSASYQGHKEVVQILLLHGASINAQGGHHGSALQAASYQGHEEVVQILLLHGASINAQGGDDDSALQAASDQGHEEVVQILLNRGANVNTQGGEGGNALQAASLRGYKIIIQILLNRGADVNAQGGICGNALRVASIRGNEKLVQMLLDKGADVNANERGGTALQGASSYGCEKVVQILLNKGADVNAQGGYSSTALQAASCNGYKEVVRILLDEGANVNVQGGSYGNALQAATRWRHKEVVQMLLDKGADVNAHGKYGSAIQLASYCDDENMMQMLLDKGADINDLQAAISRGKRMCCSILVDRDVVKRGENMMQNSIQS